MTNSIKQLPYRDQSQPSDYRPEPHDADAERAVLGALLMHADDVLTIGAVLRPDDFYLSDHSVIYQAILALVERHTAPSVMTVYSELHRTGTHIGPDTVAALIADASVGGHADYFATIVFEMARRRRSIALGTEIIRRAWDTKTPIDEVMTAINRAVTEASADTTQDAYLSAAEAVEIAVDDLLERTPSNVVTTGYRDLDRLIDGLQAGQLAVIAAKTGHGKSAWAVGLLHHHCTIKQRPAGLISLEMTPKAVTSRMIGLHGRINTRAARDPRARTEDLVERITDAAGPVSNSPLTILRSQSSAWPQIAAHARAMRARFGIELLVVDYLQLIRSPRTGRENRAQEVAEISRGLKLLAMELEIPIVALAQLNREIDHRGQDSEPQLSDLRESGAIEHDADLVVMIHHLANPSADQSNARLLVRKNREGPLGAVEVAWQPEIGRFAAYTREFGN